MKERTRAAGSSLNKALKIPSANVPEQRKETEQVRLAASIQPYQDIQSIEGNIGSLDRLEILNSDALNVGHRERSVLAYSGLVNAMIHERVQDLGGL